jgi:hypothetical protein
MSEQLLAKYLQNRKVAGPWRLEGCNGGKYATVIVIPALAESLFLRACLQSLVENNSALLARTLVIVVVNNRVESAIEEQNDNRQTLAWLQTLPVPELNLAWIDASSAGFELGAKEGVGLARKIGFDLALEYLDWSSSPVLVSLDADTLVHCHYLQAIRNHFEHSTAGAAVIPFYHQPAADPEAERAIRHYELYLRSYVFGLSQAGSPYAYHVLGSACACCAEAYLKVGGMNRRLAGEDFYFLQQLAKTVGVETVNNTLVFPSARLSLRVPFGTGRAVLTKKANQQGYHFVGAKAFACLRQWLTLVADHLDCSAETLLLQATHIEPKLSKFLCSLNFLEIWERLHYNHASEPRRLAAFHQWFDALRTRQFLTQFDVDPVSDDRSKVAELLTWGGYPGNIKVRQQLALLERLQGVHDVEHSAMAEMIATGHIFQESN